LQPTAVQITGVLTALLTAIAGVAAVYLTYKTTRDRIAMVGTAFATTVEALSADNEVKQMAAAVLLRRFFDRDSEQAIRGLGTLFKVRTPYKKEAVGVIAGMLRKAEPSNFQKVLADGLWYARDLRHADLQRCELSEAYLGQKEGDTAKVDLSYADLFEAICVETSFKCATAFKTVFFNATLKGAVLSEADCTEANFQKATLSDAKFVNTELRDADFAGAKIAGANFAGAKNIPAEVSQFLDANGIAGPNSVVPDAKK